MRLRVVVTAHGGAGDGLAGHRAEAGVRARRPRSRRRVPAPGRRRVDRPARVREPRRPARRRADRRDRRRRRARVRRARQGHQGLAGAHARRAVVADQLEDARVPSTSTSPAPRSPPARPSSPTSTVTARSKSSSATPTATCGHGARGGAARRGFKPVNVDGRVQSGAHVEPRVLARRHVDAGPVQPDEARLRGARRPRPISTVTAGSRSSVPRSTATCTRGTTTERRSPASRCSPSIRRKVSAIDPVSHHVTFAERFRRARGRRAHRDADARRSHRRRAGRRSSSARRRSTRRRRTSATARRCSRCSAASATSGTAGCTRSRPTAATRRTPTASAAHPDDQAYLPGWPAALGQLGLEVLPTIGDGITTQVAAGDVHPHPGIEIVAVTAAGPPYVLDATGHSVYGEVGGQRAARGVGRWPRRRGRGPVRCAAEHATTSR